MKPTFLLRSVLALSLALTAQVHAQAQMLEYNMGATNPCKAATVYSTILSSDENQTTVLAYDSDPLKGFKNARWETFAGSDMKLKSTVPLKSQTVRGEAVNIDRIWKIDKGYALLYYYGSKKTKNAGVAYIIVDEKGKPIGSTTPKELFNSPFPAGLASDWRVRMMFSPDSSQVTFLLVNNTSKGDAGLSIFHFDRNLKPLGKFTKTIDKGEKDVTLGGGVLDNKGVLYLYMSVEATKAERTKEAGNRTLDYIVAMNNDGKDSREYKVELPEAIVQRFVFRVEPKSDKVVIAGTFDELVVKSSGKAKTTGGIDGLFYQEISLSSNKLINTKKLDLPAEMNMEPYDRDEKSVSKSKFEEQNLVPQEIVALPDGSSVLIVEKRYVTTNSKSNTSYTHADAIYLAHFGQNVTPWLTRLAKKQVQVLSQSAGVGVGALSVSVNAGNPDKIKWYSYEWMLCGNHLVLVFNDASKNYDKDGNAEDTKVVALPTKSTSSVYAAVNLKTGVIDERRMMFNAREEGMYMAPYYCRRDKQGNMFGMVYSKRGIQLTRITPKG